MKKRGRLSVPSLRATRRWKHQRLTRTHTRQDRRDYATTRAGDVYGKQRGQGERERERCVREDTFYETQTQNQERMGATRRRVHTHARTSAHTCRRRERESRRCGGGSACTRQSGNARRRQYRAGEREASVYVYL